MASGLIGVGVGMLTTALALYIPGRRSLSREISQERMEMAGASVPAWRRLGLDFALLAAAAVAEVVALRAGAFDAPSGSVYAGQAVSLPSHLLVPALVAWLGGMLLSVRVFQTIASRLPVPAPPRFGPLLRGTLESQPEATLLAVCQRHHRCWTGGRLWHEPGDVQRHLRRR